MAAPRNLVPASARCCRKSDRSIRSDIGRHRAADRSAERYRHSWVARKARCSCTRVHRTTRIRQSRPSHRCCRRDRPIQTRQRRRLVEDTRHRDSRPNNTHRCRARNPHTRPGWARSRRRRPRVLRSRSFRLLRPRSIHRHHPDRVSQPIHTLQPSAATVEGGRSTASLRAPAQHHACHVGSGAEFSGAPTVAPPISGSFVAGSQETDERARTNAHEEHLTLRCVWGHCWSRCCVRNATERCDLCQRLLLFISPTKEPR